MAIGLINLGVGPLSSIPLLDLTGLSPSQIGSSPTITSILVGPATVLKGDTIYALPPRVINIEWLSTGAANLDVSVDMINWITIDSTLVAGLKVVTVAAVFIRPSDAVTVTCRKVRARL